MADIFLARGEGVAGVERYCVLKRILRDRASDAQFVRMFLDEARLAAQLQHPNIAQVYDIGKLGDSYFFTMEYVHGETVRAILQRAHASRRSPPLGCVLAIAAGAAAGLHHAHERIGIDGRPLGIVHRDVSPTNLMVGFDGSVKLVDFGVAKVADRVVETRSGAVKGKIGYLSPEQARGQRLDRRSDLYSLGIVLWEMLTVERLYKRDNDYDAMSAIIHDPTPPPSRYRRDIPPELDALVLRALAKSADERFQTADELAEAIESVAAQTSSPLSQAGLSRFLRELFGPRPEPWVAVHERAKGDIVTVTSEPIPAKLRVPTHDPVDRRLADVIDLSTAEATETTSALFATVTAGPKPGAVRRQRRWLPWIAGGCALGLAVGAVALAVASGRQSSQDPVANMAAPAAVPEPLVTPPPALLPAAPPPPPPAVSPSRLALLACLDGDRAARESMRCTLAACDEHDKIAQVWLAHVSPQARRDVIKACAVAGLTLEPITGAKPAAKPRKVRATTKPVDCNADSMACPH